MPARTALVTGATGFIASRLAPALVSAGWEVRACGRRPRPPDLPSEVDYRSLDLADGSAEDVADLVEDVTHVFHLAGASSSRSSQEEMDRNNIELTERLLQAVDKTGSAQRVLYMSSTAVYGEEEELPSPVREDVEPKPSRGYGKAKWGAEQVVWRFGQEGLPVVVVRPVSVHGPGAIKLLASAILDVAVERFAGFSKLSVHREPVEQRMVHVDDLVNACLHLIEHDEAPGRAFNVASGVYPSSHEVAEVLADYYGMDVELEDDIDCGPDYDRRQRAWSSMLERGMKDEIILTRERLRFLRKSNRNNRLSLDALHSTGFELRHTDVRHAILDDIAWYEERRWLLGP